MVPVRATDPLNIWSPVGAKGEVGAGVELVDEKRVPEPPVLAPTEGPWASGGAGATDLDRDPALLRNPMNSKTKRNNSLVFF